MTRAKGKKHHRARVATPAGREARANRLRLVADDAADVALVATRDADHPQRTAFSDAFRPQPSERPDSRASRR